MATRRIRFANSADGPVLPRVSSSGFEKPRNDRRGVVTSLMMVAALISIVYMISRYTSSLPSSNLGSTGEGEGLEDFFLEHEQSDTHHNSHEYRTAHGIHPDTQAHMLQDTEIDDDGSIIVKPAHHPHAAVAEGHAIATAAAPEHAAAAATVEHPATAVATDHIATTTEHEVTATEHAAPEHAAAAATEHTAAATEHSEPEHAAATTEHATSEHAAAAAATEHATSDHAAAATEHATSGHAAAATEHAATATEHAAQDHAAPAHAAAESAHAAPTLPPAQAVGAHTDTTHHTSSAGVVADPPTHVDSQLQSDSHGTHDEAQAAHGTGLPDPAADSATSPPNHEQPAQATAVDHRTLTQGVYSLSAVDIAGHDRPLSEFAGKVALIVNVASKCGYTDVNYRGLEQVYRKYRTYGFEVLAFPSNEFGSQEPGTEAEIKEFCTSKYHTTFPLFSKVQVNGPNAHPVFKYLKSVLPEDQGGGGAVSEGTDIGWNFYKFLVNRDGQPVKLFHQDWHQGVIEHAVYEELQKSLAQKAS